MMTRTRLAVRHARGTASQLPRWPRQSRANLLSSGVDPDQAPRAWPWSATCHTWSGVSTSADSGIGVPLIPAIART